MLLFQAAQVWEHLKNHSYHIIGAKKRTQHELLLCFDSTEFHHLAGFQYAKDVSFPNIAPAKYHEIVLSGQIKTESLEKSNSYESLIKPRLLALKEMESLLNSDFSMYKFNRDHLPFYSDISGDYLISGFHLSNIELVFISNEGEKYFCRSTFIQNPSRDFTRGQTKLALLYKSKRNIQNGEEHIFFDKLQK